MKLSKNLGRVATTLLATAMLASLTAVPAFAAAGDPGITTNPTENQFQIKKTVDVKENSYAPAVTVNFTVTAATAQQVTTEETKLGILPGVTGGVTQVSGATIAQGTTTGVDGTGNATFKVNLTDDEGNKIFTHAGIYKYYVTETAGQSYPGMTFSGEEKTLYVYITNDSDNLKVSYTELVDENDNADGTTSKTNNFTNYYGTDDPGTTDEEEDPLHDLTVKKIIKGTGANLGGTFDFTIKIAGDADIEANPSAGIEGVQEKFFYQVFDAEGEKKSGISDSGTMTSDAQATVSLGNGEYVIVYGLSANDEYTVVETEANMKGYITTVTGDEFDKNEDDEVINGQVSGTLPSNSDATITYTNEFNVTAPTGIVMNVAPYVLLVVVAAAGCFVFMRKRRED